MARGPRQSEVLERPHGVRILVYEDDTALVAVPQLHCTTVEEAEELTKRICALLTELGANPER